MIELVPLFKATFSVANAFPIGDGPQGTRLVGEISSATVGSISRVLPDRCTPNVAPIFETGDERYAWLNRIQAVGKGLFTSAPDGGWI